MKITSFSRIGQYHQQTDTENQDAIHYSEKNGVYVIALADGVSECKEAKCGAETASSSITNLLVNKGRNLLQYDKPRMAGFVLSHITAELEYCAARDKTSIIEYSSTIASVYLDIIHQTLVSFNLGDGMIIAVENGRVSIFSMPSDSTSGCCVTTTRDAEKNIIIKNVSTDNMECIVILSDGAWKHLFKRNKLKPELIKVFENKEFEKLKVYLNQQKCFDDCSFIALNMSEKDVYDG